MTIHLTDNCPSKLFSFNSSPDKCTCHLTHANLISKKHYYMFSTQTQNKEVAIIKLKIVDTICLHQIQILPFSVSFQYIGAQFESCLLSKADKKLDRSQLQGYGKRIPPGKLYKVLDGVSLQCLSSPKIQR
jgi:hypothetical protein